MKRSRVVGCAILYALWQKPRAAMYLGFVAVCSKTTSVHARSTPVPRSVCQQERFAVLFLQLSPSHITGTRICLFSLNRAFDLRRQRMAIRWAINSFQVGMTTMVKWIGGPAACKVPLTPFSSTVHNCDGGYLSSPEWRYLQLRV
jgi:hypothetical protein